MIYASLSWAIKHHFIAVDFNCLPVLSEVVARSLVMHSTINTFVVLLLITTSRSLCQGISCCSKINSNRSAQKLCGYCKTNTMWHSCCSPRGFKIYFDGVTNELCLANSTPSMKTLLFCINGDIASTDKVKEELRW